MKESDSKSLEKAVGEIRSQPITVKDKVLGIAIAVVLIALCVGTWFKPDLVSIDTSQFSGRGGRSIARILNVVWSRPAGTIAGIVGLITGWGTMAKKVGETPGGAKKEQ